LGDQKIGASIGVGSKAVGGKRNGEFSQRGIKLKNTRKNKSKHYYSCSTNNAFANCVKRDFLEYI
jgi:hypothetical protein